MTSQVSLYIKGRINALKVDEKAEYNALFRIVQTEDVEALKLFLEEDLNINVRTEGNETIAHKLDRISLTFFDLLVSEGLNIFALDFEGRSPLFKLSLSQANIPVQTRLMELGANPQAHTFSNQNCIWTAKANYNSQLEDLYLSFSNAKEEYSNINLLTKGKYQLAWEVISAAVNNLGGFEFVFENLDKKHLYRLFVELQKTLLCLGKNKEAVALLKMFLEKWHHLKIYTHSELLDISCAFTEGEYQLVQEYVFHVSRSASVSPYHKQFLIVQSYLYADLANQKEMADFLLDLMKRRVNQEYVWDFFKRIVVSNNEEEISILKTTIEDYLQITTSNGASEILFVKGLLALKEGDKVRAELEFRKNIEMAKSKKMNASKEYTSAVNLIRFLTSNQAE